MRPPYGSLPPPQPRFSRPTVSAGLRLAGASLRRMFFLFVWLVIMLTCAPWAIYNIGRNLGFFLSEGDIRLHEYETARNLERKGDVEKAWAHLILATQRYGSDPSDLDMTVLQTKIMLRQGKIAQARLALDKYRKFPNYPMALGEFQTSARLLARDSLQASLQSAQSDRQLALRQLVEAENLNKAAVPDKDFDLALAKQRKALKK